MRARSDRTGEGVAAQLSETERRAIDAVARHVSVSWQAGDRPSSASLTVAGRRVVVEIATLPERGSGRSSGPKVRLRDDRVARRVLSDLDAALAPGTPDGTTVVVTLGAPIRRPNPTCAAVAVIILAHLAGEAADTEQAVEVHGNRVRFLVLSGGSAWPSKIVGFVFTGDPSLRDLAASVGSLREAITAKAATCSAQATAGERWLVVAGGEWMADVETYRRALAPRDAQDAFEKVMLVVEGVVATLVE